MKQILMSKEEYDQLLQDIENLKREKENLAEKNFDKDKEIENLKIVLEKVKNNHVNYLNIVTIKILFLILVISEKCWKIKHPDIFSAI